MRALAACINSAIEKEAFIVHKDVTTFYISYLQDILHFLFSYYFLLNNTIAAVNEGYSIVFANYSHPESGFSDLPIHCDSTHNMPCNVFQVEGRKKRNGRNMEV